MTRSTAKLRKARGSVHGDFNVGAAIAQGTVDLWSAGPNWPSLNPTQKEALHMITHKVQRILTGDPNYKDHWEDIAGYAHLPLVGKPIVAAAKKPKRVRKAAKAKVVRKRVAKKAAVKKRTLSPATKKKISQAIKAKAKKKKATVQRPARAAVRAKPKKSAAKKVAKKSNVVRLRSRRSGQALRNPPTVAPTSPGGEAA